VYLLLKQTQNEKKTNKLGHFDLKKTTASWKVALFVIVRSSTWLSIPLRINQ